MNIKSQTVEVCKLSERRRSEMFMLMRRYFEGVKEESFLKDLSEKQWAVILTDKDGRTCGFSTLMIMEEVLDGREIRAFYSGDTIVDRKRWGIFSLEKSWIPFVFRQALSQPEFRWYWFFVSKGYRTFRYLPVHFKNYWPSPESISSGFELKLIAKLAKIRFGKSYDPETGIVSCKNDYRLREGVGDISSREMRSEHVRFFLRRNPGWQAGDQLPCLTELHVDNLRPMLLKFLKKELKTGL